MVREHPLNIIVAALQKSVIIYLTMKLGYAELATRNSLKVLVKIVIRIEFSMVLFRLLDYLFEKRMPII